MSGNQVSSIKMKHFFSSQGLDSLEAKLLSAPVVLIIVLMSVFLNAWAMPLFDLDEGAFTEATREMLESGNFISTYLNGEPRHDKPILIYWCQALSVSLFGFNEMALRLPSCLAALAWMWVVFRFTARHVGIKEAYISVWVLATLPVATVIFKAAIADALLNLFIVLAFTQIYEYFVSPAPGRLIKIGLVLGLGFLTKGPVAVILPIFSSFILFVVHGKWQMWFMAILSPRSIFSFLFIVTPWHIAVYFDQGWAFFEGFYLKHNISRFNDTMEAHGGSPLYYIVLLPFLLAPFFGAFIKAIKSYFIRNDLLNVLRSKPLELYFFTWFILVLGIFSFSKTQLPHYLLYGMTPVIILLAIQLQQECKRWHVYFGGIIVGFFIALPFLFSEVTPSVKNIYEKAVLRLASEIFYQHYLVSTILVALALCWVLMAYRGAFRVRALIIGFLMMFYVNGIFMPLFAEAQQGPVKKAAEIASSKFNRPMVSYVTNMPSFSVYTKSIVPQKDPIEGDLVFTRIHQVDGLMQLNKNVPLTLVFQQGGIVLYCYGGSSCE